MSTFKTYPMNNSAILRINAEREYINTSPEYQRNSDIWTLEKRQLLIDSILNDYDIPKLYFHVLPMQKKSKEGDENVYAIIDGRQRLETIWSFIKGEFTLAEDFKYFKDPSVRAGSLTYADLAKRYPRLKIIFDSFTLPIILVETDELDLIEDMFSRLNEAVPLNAAEKRNAIGGPMARTIREISNHPFFKRKVRFSNKRYQHKEVAAKLLLLEDLLRKSKRILDTKKAYLDAFVRQYKNKNSDPSITGEKVRSILNQMHNTFTEKDDLLKTQAMITIYYLLFRELKERGKLEVISRNKFREFSNEIENNRILAERDITKARFEYLEFDRMSQQGSNDAASIKERLKIISDYFGIKSSI